MSILVTVDELTIAWAQDGCCSVLAIVSVTEDPSKRWRFRGGFVHSLEHSAKVHKDRVVKEARERFMEW